MGYDTPRYSDTADGRVIIGVSRCVDRARSPAVMESPIAMTMEKSSGRLHINI
jgi:hypothetical protein